MTIDQFRKAEALHKEMLLVKAIIKEIEETNSFHRHESMGEGVRGLKRVLKEPYVLIIKALKERINALTEEIADL